MRKKGRRALQALAIKPAVIVHDKEAAHLKQRLSHFSFPGQSSTVTPIMDSRARGDHSGSRTAEMVAQELKRRGLPPTACHVPFSALILEPDGRVGSCRVKGTEFPMGNLNDQSLEEIWNGPAIQEWRRQFLTGSAEHCSTEVKHYRCHTCPEYNWFLDDVEFTEKQTRGPLRIGLNLNGKCNLECRMCHIWKEPNGLYHSKGWWKQVEPWLDQAKEVELLSGEPFIQRDTFEIMERLSKTNPSCRWSITTNGHWKLTPKIKGYLDQIQFKQLIVSIDSLDPVTYPKIRVKGDLEVVLANLDRLVEYDQERLARGLGTLNIHLSYLVQQDNWMEAARFHDFAQEKGVSIFRIFLREPYQYSLLALPETEREGILEHYFRTMTREQLMHSRRIVTPLLESLSPLARSAMILEFKKRMA